MSVCGNTSNLVYSGKRESWGTAPPSVDKQTSFFNTLIPAANCSNLDMSEGGRMSRSKIASGTARVATALGTSTMPLMRPSHGIHESMR